MEEHFTKIEDLKHKTQTVNNVVVLLAIFNLIMLGLTGFALML